MRILRRIGCFTCVLLVLLCAIPSESLAHGSQNEHDEELFDVLFGEGYNLAADKKEIFQAIADATALCIDQFSVNETIRSKEDLFNRLKEREGFSLSFDAIELQKGTGGINVTAKTHRRYTHRGWNFSMYPLPELWSKRKKILTATVNKELFGQSSGFLHVIPFLEGTLYSEDACNDQCEAFCKLAYYVHLLGDHMEADSYTPEFSQLIPLVRHEDPTSPSLIQELIDLLPVLFDGQDTTSLISELRDIQTTASAAYNAKEGLGSQENFEVYHQCAEDVYNKLVEYLPDMFRKVDFFKDVFYK